MNFDQHVDGFFIPAEVVTVSSVIIIRFQEFFFPGAETVKCIDQQGIGGFGQNLVGSQDV